jgi:hypothetical protein
LGDSMIIGDVAYQIVPGFWGTPIGSFSEHRTSGAVPASAGSAPPATAPKTDEELLAQFLIQNLE